MNGHPVFSQTVKRSVFIAVLSFVILMVILSTAGCTGQTESQIIAKDKYVFLEHHINKNGIKGPCNPGLRIDFPMYFFDKKSGKFTSPPLLAEDVNDSLILIYGSGTSLSGFAGAGTGAKVYPKYSLPFSHYDNVTVDSITADGTVFFRYNDRHLILKPNETWINVTRTMDIHGPPGNPSCIVELEITDNFYNAGILNKNDIR